MVKKPAGDSAAYLKLKKDLTSGQLERCYVLYGEEGYWRGYYLDRMRKKLLDGPAADFNAHRFGQENLDWNTVAQAVESLPMMAERSLVEIHDVDLYKENEDGRNKAAEIISDLPDYCCLIFHYDTIPFSQDKRMKKLTQALQDHAQLVEFSKRPPEDLRPWIARQARSEGKGIDREAIDHLILRTDSSMGALASEIPKLAAYAVGESITRQDVEDVVEPTLTAVSYDITDAIVGGNYDLALAKLRDLSTMQEDAIQLLGLISAQMRRILHAKVLQENGKGIGELQKLYTPPLREYPAKVAMEAARRLSRRFCDRAVLMCLEADRRMKLSSGEPMDQLELLLIRMAQEARA